MNPHDHIEDRELLQAVDQELSPRHQARVLIHLEECLVCQARHARIGRASSDFAALHRLERASRHLDLSESRSRLQQKLEELAEAESAPWPASGWAQPRWAIAGLLLAITVLIGQFSLWRGMDASSALAPVERDTLPVASLTPGATWDLSVAELCGSRARELRPVPVAVRLAVLQSYGMEGVPENEYELDYLITPELGGAPDARNLWPQRYASRVWNARVKDQLEQLLPRLVCERQVELRTAQQEIASDWVVAYKKYFKTDAPLRTQAGLFLDDDDDQDSGSPNRVMYPVWRSTDAAPLALIQFAARR